MSGRLHAADISAGARMPYYIDCASNLTFMNLIYSFIIGTIYIHILKIYTGPNLNL